MTRSLIFALMISAAPAVAQDQNLYLKDFDKFKGDVFLNIKAGKSQTTSSISFVDDNQKDANWGKCDGIAGLDGSYCSPAFIGPKNKRGCSIRFEKLKTRGDFNQQIPRSYVLEPNAVLVPINSEWKVEDQQSPTRPTISHFSAFFKVRREGVVGRLSYQCLWLPYDYTLAQVEQDMREMGLEVSLTKAKGPRPPVQHVDAGPGRGVASDPNQPQK